jgi:hypothetical protein
MAPKENNGALADPLTAIPFAAAITGTWVEGPLELSGNRRTVEMISALHMKKKKKIQSEQIKHWDIEVQLKP